MPVRTTYALELRAKALGGWFAYGWTVTQRRQTKTLIGSFKSHTSAAGAANTWWEAKERARAKKKTTLQQIRCLDVDPETGDVRRGGVSIGGDRSGYWYISIDGVQLPRSKVVWAYVHGRIPQSEIDHINGVRIDDRICNLRLAGRLQQMMNTKTYSNNSTGVKGVAYDSKRRVYVATLHFNKKQVGRLETKDFDMAVAFRRKLEEEFHGEWSRQA